VKLLLVRVLGNLGETLPTGSVNEAKWLNVNNLTDNANE